MCKKIPQQKDYPALHAEINRLRARDGLEPVGGLGFALKLVGHFHESRNPRVAEALRTVQCSATGGAACQGCSRQQ